MRVLLTHIIVPAFLLGSSFSLRAQSFLLKSNEDFGPSMTLFCDNDYPSWPYTFQVLEGERMRVEYECREVTGECLTISGSVPEMEEIICLGVKKPRPTEADPNL